MFGRIPLWIKMGLLTVSCLIGMALAVTWSSIHNLKSYNTEAVLEEQQSNLRTAAWLLDEMADGVTVSRDPDGSTRRLTVSSWPEFAGANNADHSFIDTIGTITGQTATIFAFDDTTQDYVRRTTNIIKPNGERAVGTPLGRASTAFAPIDNGDVFLGQAIILGKAYDTLYVPIFSDNPAVPRNSAGVAGILYVGIDAAESASRAASSLSDLIITNAVLITLFASITATVCFFALRPIRALAQDITAISDGHPVSVKVTRSDEIGAIQTALSRLAAVAELAFAKAQILDRSTEPVLTICDGPNPSVLYANPAANAFFKTIGVIPQDASIENAKLDSVLPIENGLRQVLSDRAALPGRAVVSVEGEKLRVNASGMVRQDGSDNGICLMITSLTHQEHTAQQFESDVAQLLLEFNDTLGHLRQRTEQLSKTASEGALDSNQAADVSAESADAIQTVAAAVEQLNASFSEVASQINSNVDAARDAASSTRDATQAAKALEVAGERISAVVNLISDVAGQTNLLALNATIEASRAGDAGRGFAVVASEVKGLAERAAKAADEIKTEVDQVNAAGRALLNLMENVDETISRFDSVSAMVAGTVEQQQSTTHQITSTIHGVATSALRVQELAQSVRDTNQSTGDEIERVAEMSIQLNKSSTELGNRADKFLDLIRDAA